MAASSATVAKTTKSGRKDPSPRHSDGQATSQRGSLFTTIVNRDPSKEYVLAWKADEQTGAPYYEALGYDVVLYHEGGPRLAGIKRTKTGEAVEFRGCVLMSIVNRDPSKEYVLAWKADEQTGAPYYEALGYDVVLYHEGGPRLAGIKRIKTGEAVEFRGCVLMSIDKDELARMRKEGDGFSLGSDWADQLETRIRKQKRAENPFSGAPKAYSQSGQPYVMEDPDKSEDPEDLNNG